MTMSNDMRRKARTAAEERPLPIPPTEPPAASAEVLAKLAEVSGQLAHQGQTMAEMRAALDAMTIRQEMTPPAAVACQEAAAQMTRAAERVSAGASLLQEVGRHFREAVEEVLSYREGRSRRLTAALLLACALPGLVGNLWLAWRAGLL